MKIIAVLFGGVKYALYLYTIMKQTNTTMKAQEIITAEFERRTNLIQDENFRNLAIEAAKKLGITAAEWNENKALLLLYFANEFCSIENRGL